LLYLSPVENPTIHTPSHRVSALSSFDLTFSVHQARQLIKLTLEPNHDIIPEGAKIEFLNKYGEVRHTDLIDRATVKVFKGHVWIEDRGGNWGNVGWARIVVRQDGVKPLFEGAFTIMHDHHHIQLRTSYMQTKHELDPFVKDSDDEYMVMFRDSDIDQSAFELKRSESSEILCPADELTFNTQPDHPIYSNVLRRDGGYWASTSLNSLFGKRQIDTGPGGKTGNSAGVNLKSTIGDTAGCPSTRKVALVGVATDCTYTASFNSTESARQNVITQINSASDLYEKSFNITLGLSTLTVSDTDCPGTPPPSAPWNSPCTANATIQDRLNTFSAWRGTKQDDGNAYWTLLTMCNTGPAVGLAWLGQACVSDAQVSSGETVSGANVVARTSTEWQVIA
jgi:Metallo-peptidase family M12